MSRRYDEIKAEIEGAIDEIERRDPVMGAHLRRSIVCDPAAETFSYSPPDDEQLLTPEAFAAVMEDLL